MNAGKVNVLGRVRNLWGVAMRMNHSATNTIFSSSSKMQLEGNNKGYPERTFNTKILKVDPLNINFSGKGKEPLRDVEVIISDDDQKQNLYEASHALQQGNLVAFPTETVYGLAGNALDENAASKIFKAKGRPADNPLIVHISSMSMLEPLIDESFTISPMYAALIDSFWPGPLTLLFPANQINVPSVVRCGLPSLGIRMPSHSVARALIATSNVPLAAPSANVSGKPSPTKAEHVFHDMTSTAVNETGENIVSGRIPYIVDGGPSDVGLESTVVDGITKPTELRILRPGGVTVEAIEEALQKAGLFLPDSNSLQQNGNAQQLVKVRVYGRDMAKDTEAEQNPTTPGMKYRHYSPEARVIVLVTSSSSNKDSRTMAAQSIGESAARKLLSKSAKEAINEEVRQFKQQTQKDHVEIGLMSMDDSKLTGSLMAMSRKGEKEFSLHRFSLGNSSSPEEAAHRLFDGLRTLDQGKIDANEQTAKCDIIFVEAVSENFGVGLAIMNRLNKAASQTILVDV